MLYKGKEASIRCLHISHRSEGPAAIMIIEAAVLRTIVICSSLIDCKLYSARLNGFYNAYHENGSSKGFGHLAALI